MQSSNGTFHKADDTSSQVSGKMGTISKRGTEREKKLSGIANSVTGFYRDPSEDERAKMRSTHESNFARDHFEAGKKNTKSKNVNSSLQSSPKQQRSMAMKTPGALNEGTTP